jgi:predicted NUDIX family NTP pyrophosphohydrolase
MTKLSAGILMFRLRDDVLEVLIVHPGGPFWQRKDEGAWSIPKGEYDEGDDPFEHAKREFQEELGSAAPTDGYAPLGEIKQPSGKIVTCWTVEGNVDVTTISSNLFTMEWPRGSGKVAEFPEVDKAAWFCVTTARRKLLKGHVGFLDRLQDYLKREGIEFAKHCQQAYLAATPRVRRQLNQAIFEKLYVHEDQEITGDLAEPFRTLLGSEARGVAGSPDDEKTAKPPANDMVGGLRVDYLVDLSAGLSSLSTSEVRLLVGSAHDGSTKRAESIRPKQRQRQVRLPDHEVAQLVADYQAGVTVQQLSRFYAIHRTTVLEHLESRGVARRQNVRKLTDGDVKIAAQLYETGVSLATVGKAFNVDSATIRREFARSGIPARSGRQAVT